MLTSQTGLSRQTGYDDKRWIAMLSALIGVLIIVVIGAICFWAIDRFAMDRRLAQLLKLLVILICLAAILQRILPLLGVYI
jgi:Kef-type K+ transport system membrane component KefB